MVGFGEESSRTLPQLPSYHNGSQPRERDKDDLDLLHSVKGLHRLLFLYSESSTSGLVEKIIIAHESLGALINTLSPRAYSSLSKINFKSLDKISIQPIGVYGSKSEIVRLLQQLECVDSITAQHLLQPREEHSLKQPWLRSGLYYLNLNSSSSNRTSYVVYWPEDTTWDDGATDSVRRNRTTFMRYLTRLVDQTCALMSPDHASKLISASEEPEPAKDLDDGTDHLERFFKFEVSKTKDQEEGVVIHPGFEVHHSSIKSRSRPSTVTDNHDDSKSAETAPTFVNGEGCFGFASMHHIPPGLKTNFHRNSEWTTLKLAEEIDRHRNIFLAPTLTRDAVYILTQQSPVRKRARALIEDHEDRLATVRGLTRQTADSTLKSMKNELTQKRTQLVAGCRALVITKLREIYPTIDLSAYHLSVSDEDDYFRSLLAMYDGLAEIQNRVFNEASLEIIPFREFQDAKSAYLTLVKALEVSEGADRDALIRKFLEADEGSTGRSTPVSAAKAWFTRKPGEVVKRLASILPALPNKLGHLDVSNAHSTGPKDPAFISSLSPVLEGDSLSLIKNNLLSLCQEGLKKHTHRVADSLFSQFEKLISREQATYARVEAESWESKEISQVFTPFLESLKSALVPAPTPAGITFESIERIGPGGFRYCVTARETTNHVGSLQYTLFSFELSEDDRRHIDQDPYHTINPILHKWLPFELAEEDRVRYCQFLEMGNKCLVIIDTPRDVFVYIANRGNIARLATLQYIRRFRKDGGRTFSIAVQEKRRLLAVATVTETQVSLQMFAFDATLSGLQARGSPQDITHFYQDGIPSLQSIHFGGDIEEICLVEDSGRIRIFSFVSQTFRPGIVKIDDFISIHASPDGSALIAVEKNIGGYQLRTFHWESFGHHPGGIVVDLSGNSSLVPSTLFGVVSFGRHCLPLLLAMDENRHVINALNLQITSKNEEYSFRSTSRNSKANLTTKTTHNSLIDCHAGVWSKFPVVSAFKRESSHITEFPVSLTFVLEEPHCFPFLPHFKRLIKNFEHQTKKPTDGLLEKIEINACTFVDISWRDHPRVNSYLAGEWIAGLLCLIPIHIALARENRFIPLKDGILDAALEQKLLGADLSHIIDSISVGWYESIFNSYMAEKPVKVISSMGEQSVGKSYTLNHIVDSSFAGSALRTTEGVWLSVCPTKELLVVALDFEGVHSIERSPQEDMLLVLFNTALSNMVLFRNNFAISRDIANMFTSFQSSTSVLDPASNPNLFKSLLAIIIKDVVESDKREIVAEFSSKLGRIVSEEQASNFITVLHNSQLTVVPWPVIQSQEFYSLFGYIRTSLIKQQTTHRNAGEFLLTLKTLMAKLKAQDWASIDQNLTKHRALILSQMLPLALEHGVAETGPDIQELKNLDDQSVVPHQDSRARLYVPKTGGDKLSIFADLVNSWRPDAGRHDLDELGSYLSAIVESRIQHVHDWLEINTTRFSNDNADIRMLKQSFTEGADSLRVETRICRARCPNCALSCILPRSHDRSKEHACGTNHKCLSACEIGDEHEEIVNCGLQAGHASRHLCDPESHCCGQKCVLHGRPGCQLNCIKPIDHDSGDEHTCASSIHYCGMPCALQGAMTSTGPYYCDAECMVPIGHEHTIHVCEARSACPITCALCPRLCAVRDHVHGLESNAVHLCGQTHPCTEECESPGTCEINTEPHSVESTFIGIHETFQYTKFTQLARRLPCIIQIPPGSLFHEGSHVHDTRPDAFHFCTECCENCGYICTLPLGHSQPLHETAHGSMENTRWLIEDGNEVELLGRRFVGHDSGGPQLCNMVCAQLGRHTHVAICRTPHDVPCHGNDWEHSADVFFPFPQIPKDWISHKLYWARTGFKDPYSREEQIEFSKCDSRCAAPRIKRLHNNRYGAVLSALYEFWTSRATGSTQQGARRDAYSILLFNKRVEVVLSNDNTSSPDSLLACLLGKHEGSGTSFDSALVTATSVMERFWNTERSPVVVFLSDGESMVSPATVNDLARRAVALGKPLSLHAISFGRDRDSQSLRYMARVTGEIAKKAPRDPMTRPAECTYSDASSTLQLTETFLQIAQSLRRPRASLLRS
ncbi:hypothetical protein FRC03_006451 [Tulasnella sp. 419]|nr:hypothetical protein FRC03_006451 [Tulasnella sp. 419]